jgi:hypothetical protein
MCGVSRVGQKRSFGARLRDRDAGVALRDVQIAARHSDPRTTTRYDRARHNLDRHASYIVTAFIAGAN